MSYGVLREGRSPFLALSLEGATLDDQPAPLPPPLVEAAAAALHRVHAAGVAHGDIRLPNFVVAAASSADDPEPRVMVLDFAMAYGCTDAAVHAGELRELINRIAEHAEEAALAAAEQEAEEAAAKRERQREFILKGRTRALGRWRRRRR